MTDARQGTGHTLIEHELQLMLAEGFDKVPILPRPCDIRLKARGIVNGGLSNAEQPRA